MYDILELTPRELRSLNQQVLLGLASGVHSAVGLFAGGKLCVKLSHRSKMLTRAPPEISPHRYKFMIQTAILIPMVISPGLGAYIGRACVETHSWRWIYYILIVILGTCESCSSADVWLTEVDAGQAWAGSSRCLCIFPQRFNSYTESSARYFENFNELTKWACCCSSLDLRYFYWESRGEVTQSHGIRVSFWVC